MQHFGVRVATATDLVKAVGVTTEIASYVHENHGWDLRVGVNHSGPADQVSIFSRNDSLDQLLGRRASLMTDPGMAELMQRAGELVVAGSAHTYILRPLFGAIEETEKDLIYFRVVSLKPNALGAVVVVSEQICNHLRNEHGMDTHVSVAVGGAGDTMVWGTRVDSGDEIEAAFEATMADDDYNQWVASISEHIADIQDRIVRLLPR